MTESHQQLLDKTCKYLRSTLLSQKFGVAVDQLTRDYMDMVGDQIPYQQLSFPSLQSFLMSIPNVCRISGSGRDLTVVGVASKATSHIEDMVRKQNSKKKGSSVGKQKGSFYPGTKFYIGGARVAKYRTPSVSINNVRDHSRGSYGSGTGTGINGWAKKVSSNIWGTRSSQNTSNGIYEPKNYNGHSSSLNAGNYSMSSKQHGWCANSNVDEKPNDGKFKSHHGWVGNIGNGKKSLNQINGFIGSNNNCWVGSSSNGYKSNNLMNGHTDNSSKIDQNKQNGYTTIGNSKQHGKDYNSVTTVEMKKVKASGSIAQTSMSSDGIGRVQQLLAGRPHGLFVSQVEKMFEKQFGVKLSSDWVKQMGGLISVDSSHVCRLVQTEKAKVSVSSFCPDSSVSQVYGQKTIITHPYFPRDSNWDIFVCCVPEINKIYFHLNKFQSQFQDLYTEMTQYYTKASCEPVSTPIVGDFYCARLGGEFCRVQMVDNSQVDNCLCLLVDLGVTESVMLTDLLYLAPPFQMLPIQAITGRLSGIDFTSDPAFISLVSKTLEGRSFTAIVINLSELGDSPGGNTIDPSFVLLDGKVQVTAQLIDRISGNGEPDKLSNIMSHLTFCPPDIIPNTTLPSVGDYFDVTVSLVYTPHRFIVQPYSDRKKYQDLVMEMNIFYNSVKKPVMVTDYEEGDLFAVKQGNSWARSKLEKKMMEDKFALRLVDSGCMVLYSPEDLQLLRSEFCSLPAQAAVASLGGIRPLVNDNWENSVVNWFKSVVVGNSFVGLVEDIRIEEGQKVLDLQLFDTSDSKKDVNINKEMMKRIELSNY